MTKKIFRSTITVVNITLLLCLSIVMGVLYSYFLNMEKTQLKNEIKLIEGGVALDGVAYLESQKFENIRVTLIDGDGKVVFDSAQNADTMDNHMEREEVLEAFETGYGESSRYSSTLMNKRLYYAKLMEDGRVLRVSVGVISVVAVLVRVFIPVAVVFTIAILVSIAVVKHLAGKIVEPLNEINLDKPLENENAYEELAPLLGKINKQRKELSKKGKALRKQEDEFRQITEFMSEGLVILNEKAELISINEAARKYFDIEEDCVGKEFLKIDRSPKMTESIGAALKGQSKEFFIHKDGREYRININGIESEGQIFGVVILVFDVTEQAMFRKNRQEFTANVSHELKTPLQSIIGSAELLENDLVKPEDVGRFVGHIRREAERMVDLVNDTIKLSHLDEMVEVSKEEVALLSLAGEVVESLKDFAVHKNVKLMLTGEDVNIFTVKKYMYDILYNLCENAIRYNVENGEVRILIENGKITVSDTGIGIPTEHQERVFERFYRVDKSHSRETGGTGLGLSIVKNAVQYIGGQINMISEINKGTSVEISF